MVKAKDRTSYRQGDTERIPRIVDFVIEDARITYTVHRHIDYPGTWLLSCNGYFDKEDLHTDDFDEAAKKANMKILFKFQSSIVKLSMAIDEIKRSYTEEDGQ